MSNPSNLFIPSKIRIGFCLRDGTYTGKLAYVIYYDAKGKLRKEKSWQTWRNDKIEPVEFDNKPQDGFVVNKGIQRYNWGHFGSNRSYIRIYDSRGIEFEITPENLIGLLVETNCSRRGLEGEFVYAWHGTELVLLPCSSQEYSAALKNTERQGKKVSARDLKPGCSYTTKKGEEVIYMGRFPWFTWSLWKKTTRISQKKHIFAHPSKPKYGELFFPKGDASFLAELNNPDPVANYADLVDQFNGSPRSSVFDEWKSRPLKPTNDMVFKFGKDRYDNQVLKRENYTSMKGDEITFWNLVRVNTRYGKGYRGYRLVNQGTLNTKTLTYTRSNDRSYYYHYDDDRYGPVLKEQQVLDKLVEFVEVDIVLSTGKKLRLKNIESIAKD